MSAHVLLNLLNELWKRDKMHGERARHFILCLVLAQPSIFFSFFAMS